MGKNGPNLRDFRIDTPEGSRSNSNGAPEDSITRPRQNISARTSSVQEWGSPSWQGKEHGDLWQAWEEDEEFNARKNAAQKQSAQNQNATAAASASGASTANSQTASAAKEAANSASVKEATAAARRDEDARAEETQSVNAPSLLPWASELALEERKMDRMGVVDFSNSFKKQDLLKRLTREFMRKLRETFQKEIEVFNSSRQSASHAVHLYRVSNTEEDFMLFRNGVKLVVSGERSGRVVLAFNQFLGQIFTPSQQQPNFELEASWGAFDQLHWNYRTERVSIPDVVRFFLGEFVRQSYK
jgi:hypothetical protein